MPEREDARVPAPTVTDRSMPELDSLYREVVLDHYKRPRGRAKLVHPTLCTSGFNPTCGDQIMLSLDMEQGAVKGVEAQCQGCSISVASASMMAELLKGKTREEISRLVEAVRSMMHGHEPDPNIDLGDLEALSGVARFPVRVKCALLAWTTLQEALRKLDAPGAAGTPQEV